jgi:hypothetical protein
MLSITQVRGTAWHDKGGGGSYARCLKAAHQLWLSATCIHAVLAGTMCHHLSRSNPEATQKQLSSTPVAAGVRAWAVPRAAVLPGHHGTCLPDHHRHPRGLPVGCVRPGGGAGPGQAGQQGRRRGGRPAGGSGHRLVAAQAVNATSGELMTASCGALRLSAAACLCVTKQASAASLMPHDRPHLVPCRSAAPTCLCTSTCSTWRRRSCCSASRRTPAPSGRALPATCWSLWAWSSSAISRRCPSSCRAWSWSTARWVGGLAC